MIFTVCLYINTKLQSNDKHTHLTVLHDPELHAHAHFDIDVVLNTICFCVADPSVFTLTSM